MDIEPAHVNQVQRASNGRMVTIDADAGGVVDDLKRIDPHLKVRFAENGQPPFWAVRWESDDRRETYLVLTVKAYQTNSGVWAGLDQRVVRRVEKIGHESYDYAGEIERANREAHESKHATFREQVSSTAEMAAHAIRKDLGVKNRIFVKQAPANPKQ